MTTAPPQILAISSQVAFGRVGLSAISPTLHMLGQGAIALPSILLSNHPGHPAVAGAPVSPEQLRKMLAAVEANGWLRAVRTVLTGYLPSAEHVAVAAEAVDLARAQATPPPRVIVDPVMGDDPKGLYLPVPAAEALRETLAPRADILTPNFFELRFLAATAGEGAAPGGLSDLSEAARIAEALRRRYDAAEVIVTSAPAGPGRLGNVSARPGAVQTAVVDAAPGAPNGTGDVFSALIAAGDDMPRAVGRLSALLRASLGAGDASPPSGLAIVEAAEIWRNAPSAPTA